ncbi:MAG: hypothetical protein ACE5IH_03115 [Thermodesulfobacteriota bacterium]
MEMRKNRLTILKNIVINCCMLLLLFIVLFACVSNKTGYTITTSGMSKAPADSMPARAVQPDGFEFKVFLKGDERRSWHETEDGYSVVFVQDNRTWYYAECSSEERLAPSRFEIGAELPEGWPKHLRPDLSGCGK